MSESPSERTVAEDAVESIYSAITDAVNEVVIGNEEVVEGLTIALLTRGHVLLEGVPGVAKTTIANVFSRATGLAYNRIQMTPDVLPADITGTQIYRENTGEFELRKGPVFGNVIVADEINRATPKTQSALLEAMQEQQVTIDGETLGLPDPFVVIATQNPIEMDGTFELPEAQRDRFALKYTVDLPSRENESALFDRFDKQPNLSAESVGSVVDTETILAARNAVTDIYLSEPIREYILDIVHATRDNPSIEHGGSPRATLTFLTATKARAGLQGRSYVLPDDVKSLVQPVLVHRIVRNTDARLSNRSTREILTEIIDTIPTPGSEASFQPPAGGSVN